MGTQVRYGRTQNRDREGGGVGARLAACAAVCSLYRVVGRPYRPAVPTSVARSVIPPGKKCRLCTTGIFSGASSSAKPPRRFLELQPPGLYPTRKSDASLSLSLQPRSVTESSTGLRIPQLPWTLRLQPRWAWSSRVTSGRALRSRTVRHHSVTSVVTRRNFWSLPSATGD